MTGSGQVWDYPLGNQSAEDGLYIYYIFVITTKTWTKSYFLDLSILWISIFVLRTIYRGQFILILRYWIRGCSNIDTNNDFLALFKDKMDFELSEKFQRIDFEIEQALKNVGYNRRRRSEDTTKPYSNREYSTKNSLHPGCSDIWTEDKNCFENSARNYDNYTSMKRHCNTGLPSNGHDTAKDVTYIKPAYCRKMITDSTSVLINNAATNKSALIGDRHNHSTPCSTPVSVQGGQKRPRSPRMTEKSKLPRSNSLSPRINNCNEHQITDLSPKDGMFEKPASPRSTHTLFVKLNRPKSPAPKLLSSEISPKGDNIPKSPNSNSYQRIRSPRQSKSVSHFVTPGKARPRSSSLISIPLRDISAALPQRPRSALLSPRLTERTITAHKYEPKGTNVAESSQGRFCGSTVYLKYSVTSPRRNPVQHRRHVSLGTVSDEFSRKDKDQAIPRIVVTDWDTCTNQQLIYLDTGSNSNVEQVFKDSGNDVRRRNSDPGTLDGLNESDAHYQAMFLDRRRSSFGDTLPLSNQIGLDLDNHACR